LEGRLKGKGKEEMTRTALFFRSSSMQRLHALSDVTGAPIAELIRRAVDAYLELRKNEILKR
jgi:predicted DNA-binding protein